MGGKIGEQMRRRLARLDELPEGSGFLAELGEGEPDVALFRSGSEVAALHATCPHRGAVLASARCGTEW